jgi:hypothetical protein
LHDVGCTLWATAARPSVIGGPGSDFTPARRHLVHLDLSKGDDLVEFAADLGTRHAEYRAVQIFSRPVSSG